MRFFLCFILLFSSAAFSQIKRTDKDTVTPRKINSSGIKTLNSVDRFSSINTANPDSLKVKQIITKTGDTIAPIGDYKIFNERKGTSGIDTILSIKKQYAFNYLRKDLFGLLGFNNDGQTYQVLDPNYVKIDNIINFGFNARRFTYLNREDIDYYRVPTPASEAFYSSVTGKGQNLDAFITLNTSEQFNFFIGYRGLRSQGKYLSQLVSNGNFRIGSSYYTKDKRYQFKNHITFQDMTQEENGGMLNVNEFNTSDAPYDNREQINLQMRDAITVFKGLRTYFDHSFQFNKSQSNKALIRHQFTYEYFSNLYQQINSNPFNNQLPYFGSAFSTGIHDKVRHKRFENTFDVAFDSKAVGLFAVSAGVYNFSHEYGSVVFKSNNERIPDRLKDEIVTLGGSYFLNKEKVVADLNVRQSVIGRALTDVKVNAAFNLNEKYGVEATYRLESRIPDYTYQLFQSDYTKFNWFNDFSNEKINTLSARIKTPFIELSSTYQMINDKLYFSNDVTALGTDGRAEQLIVSPKQYGKPINYFMVKAHKEFVYKKWAFDNTVMFQQVVQDADILNVPQIITRNSIYYSDHIFNKALYFQTGIVLNYFTKYYANEYHPVIGDFVVQNQVKIGNFPVLDFFLNAKIKTAQIYVNVAHFNAPFTGYNYYNTPTYSYRDLTFRLGIKWNFFN